MATNFNYDCLAQCFLDDLGAKKNGYRPSLPYGYKGNWQFTLLDADVSNVSAYRAAVDTDFSSATAPMCRTATGIEFSTDTDGNTVLSVPIDAKTTRFQEVCDGRQSVTAYMEIAGLDGDGNQCFYICFPINCTYVIDPEGAGEVEPVAVTNLTEAQVAAIAYANSPTITVEQTDTGATVTANNKNGTTSAATLANGVESPIHSLTPITPTDASYALAPSIDTIQIAVSSALTLTNGFTNADKVGYLELILDITGEGAISADGATVVIADALVSGNRNYCSVRFIGGVATLYVLEDCAIPAEA